MALIRAIVTGDIPKHRVLTIKQVDNSENLHVGVPAEHGGYVEFATRIDLKDGQKIDISLKPDTIWKIETCTPVRKGEYVAAYTDGRVGVDDNAPTFIGYAIDSGDEGDVVHVVKQPRINLNSNNGAEDKPDRTEQKTKQQFGSVFTQEELDGMTVTQLREIAKGRNIVGYSSMKKDELIAVIQGCE